VTPTPRRAAIVVVGCSLGGLDALRRLLGGLPAGFPLPVAIVQHRAPDGGPLALLAAVSALPVCEPADKQPLEPGVVYLAPADYHLLVDGPHFALSTAPPVTMARPSVDMLFESAADTFGPGVVAVVLTGANHDGAAGAARVKARGGVLIVQDPGEAAAPGMPAAAIAQTTPDAVLPIDAIASALARRAAAEPGADRG